MKDVVDAKNSVHAPTLCRSLIYVPGINLRALEKARTLNADGLILDLEDAVAPQEKTTARQHVCAAIQDSGFGAREVVVRINGLDTPWGSDDLHAICAPKQNQPHAILVPKIMDAAQIEDITAQMADFSGALWLMVETPQAILNIAEIAGLAQKTALRCLVMGTNDLMKELGGRLSASRAPLLPALGHAVLGARTQGLAIIDGVFNDIGDGAGFIAECQQGADFGFDGKTLIHPSQIADANLIFAPDKAAIEHARNVVSAFAEPKNAGKGVLALNGQMVELLHRDTAMKIIAKAEAIAARDR